LDPIGPFGIPVQTNNWFFISQDENGIDFCGTDPNTCFFLQDGYNLTQQRDFTCSDCWDDTFIPSGYNLNGNNKTITLNIGTNTWHGLVGSGNHTNIKITGDLSNLVNADYSGIIVSNDCTGSITNCSVNSTGSLTIGIQGGGIVGSDSKLTVSGCSLSTTSTLTIPDWAGGITGSRTEGTISSCSITTGTTLTLNDYSGGITGKDSKSTATVSDCTIKSNTNSINKSSTAGEFIGGGSLNSVIYYQQ
jgi:hypothetical protein